MTAAFAFRTAARVVFGRGSRDALAAEASRFGRRVMLVTGGRSLAAHGELDRLRDRFESAGLQVAPWAVRGEPEVAMIDAGAAIAIAFDAQVVVAVGGGSVIDAGKAIAAVATNGGRAIEYLEDLPAGGGRGIATAPLPFVAAPTTAGTGSEVTRNAVLRVADLGLKRSMRDDRMLAAVAIVDPDLAASAPPEVAVPAGLDALTHLIEAYVSRGAQPTTDLLALAGARRAMAALGALGLDRARAPAAVTAEPWDELALASLWGGMALANAGLGAVHGLAAPAGGSWSAPHGAVCGALLAPTIRANVEALRSRDADSPALARYADLSRALVGEADPLRLVAAVDALRRRLGSKPLLHYGARAEDITRVVAASRGGSMKSNPIALTDAELEAIVRAGMT